MPHPAFFLFFVDHSGERDPCQAAFSFYICYSHMITLPAVAIAWGHMVHKDVSTGSLCPEAGHVDHGTDDKVVPKERTEEKIQFHGCRERAAPGKCFP